MNERVKDKPAGILRVVARMNECIMALVADFKEQATETPKVVVERKLGKEMLTVQETMRYTGYREIHNGKTREYPAAQQGAKR
jgi:predicted transcriptional regulator